MTFLPRRIAGVIVLAACVIAYTPGAAGMLDRVVLPLGMALAAWLMVQNLAAVALGTALLAGIHAAPGAADPVAGIVYPGIAIAAGLLLAVILGKRFRARIEATHEARWRSRRGSAPQQDRPAQAPQHSTATGDSNRS